MENYGLTESLDQEEWEEFGSSDGGYNGHRKKKGSS
jgi:hypothetical protein